MEKVKAWCRGLGQEIPSVLSNQVNKKWGINKESHPKLFPFFIIFLIVSILAIPGSFLNWYGLPELFSKYFPGDTQAAAVIISQPTKCKPFNPSNWETGQGELTNYDSVWILSTSSPNGMFRFKDLVPINTDLRVVFVPHSDSQVNFVITMHDIYEVVVGDGSYQGITVKVAQGNNQKMKIIPNTDGFTRNIFDDGEMEKGNAITVILDQGISLLDNGEYELNLKLSRGSAISDSTKKVFATYNFPLPPKFSFGEETGGRVSIGLRAATDKSKIATEIICFEKL